MSKTRVLNGKVISSDRPGVSVGDTYKEKVDPALTPGSTPQYGAVTPLTPEQKTIAGTPGVPNTPLAPSAPVPTQPSPTTVKAGAGLPGAPTPITPAPTPQSPAQKGFANAQASGTTAPADAGTARNAVSGFTPAPPPDTSGIDSVLAQDKGYQQLLADQKEYNDVVNQQQSLTDTYSKLIKKAGIPGIDTQLLNAKKVIDGTEDDIRKEVQAVSGFATESQVMALASARNKTLIQNYNNLLDTKQMAMENINTMIGLAKEDHAQALQNITAKMGIDEKLMEYRDKFVNNAKEAYNNVISKVGYQGLYNSVGNSGDPTALSTVERTLGLASGQLQALGTAPKSEEDQLDIKYKKAQIANIYDEISHRNDVQDTGTISGKPQNASQSAANSYANRLAESNIVLDNLGSKFTGNFSQLPAFNFMKSGDRQAYEQAQKNFVTAVLRRESGASIAPTEFNTARDIYFPKPGDTTETIKQKAVTRNTVINNFYREANVNRPVLPGQVIESNGKKYKVGADGETLTEI